MYDGDKNTPTNFTSIWNLLHNQCQPLNAINTKSSQIQITIADNHLYEHMNMQQAELTQFQPALAYMHQVD